MKKDEIIKELEKNNTNVLSFPNRGPWGDNRWRGNCSGWIHALLMYKYLEPGGKFAELFAGSGTGSDVARDMGVPYIGADLNPQPVRPDILVCNAITDEVPYLFSTADLLFMHPPYPEIKIPYAGSMYPDPTGELRASDIGQMSWEKGMKILNEIIMKYYASMKAGAKLAVLVGEVRRNGQYYSMMNDLVKPGRMEQMYVKLQHHCTSDGRRYSKKITLTAYEMMYVIEKVSEFFFSYILPKRHQIDARDSKNITWRSLVAAVIRNAQKPLHEKDIYETLRFHKKAQSNNHLEAKIRQTLQECPEFVRVAPATYRLLEFEEAV